METAIFSIESWMRAERPDQILRTLRSTGWLKEHAPELDRLYGIPQHAEHHPEIDVGLHIELTLEMAARLSTDPKVRYAALIHDLGKAMTAPKDWPKHFEHEQLGVRPGLAFGRRMGVPKEWRLLGALVTKYHLRVHRIGDYTAKHIVRFLRDARFFDRPQLLEPVLVACEADARGRAGLQERPYPQADLLRTAFAAARRVDVQGSPSDYHQARIRQVAAALRII